MAISANGPIGKNYLKRPQHMGPE